MCNFGKSDTPKGFIYAYDTSLEFLIFFSTISKKYWQRRYCFNLVASLSMIHTLENTLLKVIFITKLFLVIKWPLMYDFIYIYIYIYIYIKCIYNIYIYIYTYYKYIYIYMLERKFDVLFSWYLDFYVFSEMSKFQNLWCHHGHLLYNGSCLFGTLF